MKTFLYILLFSISTASFAQIVNIPDINFKNALIDEDVDTNNDGEIQVSEAEAILNLNVSFKDILSLEGIQSFVNLEALHCTNNQLSTLDMSQNLNLQWLRCGGNQMSNLNVTQNLNLINLWCDNNELSDLDVTQNLNLESLWCWNNPLGSIDVSENLNLEDLACSNTQLSVLNLTQNLNLKGLDCANNQLTTLDLTSNILLQDLGCDNNQLTNLYINNGNNHNLQRMISTGNVGLTCIQVDDENAIHPECQGFPLVGWCKDGWTSYSEDCSLGVTDIENFNFNLYPNPAKNKLFLTSKNTTENLTLKIFNLEGKLLSRQKVELQNQTFIDVSNLTSGIYFLNIEDENGNTTFKKFLKQ
jgi:hypothetical protein